MRQGFLEWLNKATYKEIFVQLDEQNEAYYSNAGYYNTKEMQLMEDELKRRDSRAEKLLTSLI